MTSVPWLQHDEPLLAKMPERPTLIDFYKLRFAPNDHNLQSARLALKNGEPEKDSNGLPVCTTSVRIQADQYRSWLLVRTTDPRRTSRKKLPGPSRSTRRCASFPDTSVGYEYPEAYIRFFGKDYRPEPYLVKEHEAAKNHKWYMSARKITVNDLYSFEKGRGSRYRRFYRYHRPQFQAAEGRAGF